ncbi:hypothetical protein ES708_22986 [subsurface metagenome]
MTSYKKCLELLHLADRAKANGNYTLAEKLIKQLFQEAVKTHNVELIKHVSQALLEHRRLHLAHVFKILKQIDPIQAQRKVLS